MTQQSFDTRYLFADVTVTIDLDDNGKIVDVHHLGNPDMKVDIPDDLMDRFNEDTYEERMEYVRKYDLEMKQEAKEYDQHIRSMSHMNRYV